MAEKKVWQAHRVLEEAGCLILLAGGSMLALLTRPVRSTSNRVAAAMLACSPPCTRAWDRVKAQVSSRWQVADSGEVPVMVSTSVILDLGESSMRARSQKGKYARVTGVRALDGGTELKKTESTQGKTDMGSHDGEHSTEQGKAKVGLADNKNGEKRKVWFQTCWLPSWRWKKFLPELNSFLKWKVCPDILLIHLGDNNMVVEKDLSSLRAMKQDLKEIKA
ncbi:hypothetical protein NDU88_009884 [Pleurodeles waltl]|uniref:Uncharacterized protein n=1 Tax=Pleurodeles waltl TaxID=8319 RepID=A0AAV7QSV1_PLEWA|nr:hypothetical protein NDU88_009884 [Pleurodeles waltl]